MNRDEVTTVLAILEGEFRGRGDPVATTATWAQALAGEPSVSFEDAAWDVVRTWRSPEFPTVAFYRERRAELASRARAAEARHAEIERQLEVEHGDWRNLSPEAREQARAELARARAAVSAAAQPGAVAVLDGEACRVCGLPTRQRDEVGARHSSCLPFDDIEAGQ